MAWKDLSIAQRSQLMNLYRRNGITSLSEMRQNYDLFSLPSQEESQMIGRPMAPIYAGGGNKEPYLGKITQRRKWNAFDSWMANNPNAGHRLRKLGVLMRDAGKLLPGIKIKGTVISPATVANLTDIEEARMHDYYKDSAADIVNIGLGPLSGLAKSEGTKALLKTTREVYDNKAWPKYLTRVSRNIKNLTPWVNAAQFIDDFATPIEKFKHGGIKF